MQWRQTHIVDGDGHGHPTDYEIIRMNKDDTFHLFICFFCFSFNISKKKDEPKPNKQQENYE